ncbi:50S ribosomal protein L24 [Buchnera aphidicola]|uniref:50S ribosomal protein L24 n=1 Tax=Buchnera aphidicola TaxID=9 RepID=UPI00094D0CD2|nr:50S ribosomal protein L24 [Buchnera aphidicola]
MSAKIRKNDLVIVLTGRDKGKTGIVKYIYPVINKAIVENINMVKKHQKSAPSKQKKSGIINKESLIDISNLAFFNKKNNKKEKIKFLWINNKKVRVFKSNNQII